MSRERSCVCCPGPPVAVKITIEGLDSEALTVSVHACAAHVGDAAMIAAHSYEAVNRLIDDDECDPAELDLRALVEEYLG